MEPGAQTLAQGLEEPAKRLLKLAIASLARREHSRAEIERKLRRQLRAGDDPADIGRVIARLESRQLLSNERMALALVRTRAPRYGRLRIAQELERRGVDRELISKVLPAAEEEAAVALAVWRSKFGTSPATHEERARQGRFLAARGFSSDVIARILARRAEMDE